MNFRNSKVLRAHKIIKKKIPQNVTIIAQDCIGGAMYQFMGKEYCTPTIGLWISTPDYMKFIQMIDELSDYELVFDRTSEFGYPIGYINGIKIGFQHYKSEQEAKEKWNRRCQKMDVENIFYLVDFRYPWFKDVDIKIWNELNLPRSLAIINDKVTARFGKIHNSLILESEQDYNNTRKEIMRKFVFWTWFNKGQLKNPNFLELLQLKFLSFLYHK